MSKKVTHEERVLIDQAKMMNRVKQLPVAYAKGSHSQEWQYWLESNYYSSHK